MSFFFEDDNQKRLRLEREVRERREKQEIAQRKKDKIRLQKRRAKDAEFQKKIDEEVEKMMEYNSGVKKKERLENMTGTSLMGSAFFGGGFSANNGSKTLRSSEAPGSLMSLDKTSSNLQDSGESTVKVPKLSRPF